MCILLKLYLNIFYLFTPFCVKLVKSDPLSLLITAMKSGWVMRKSVIDTK